ncbi:hypothetical protein ACFPYI_06525 [Halomarina salina]|uniref:Uncharacterized protein n=1 Tax=Halomarina salina TaxID=1872699 RepID=A0ABD5RKH6_9EURY|nr:hypothetical protein [Halomarina salina]
MWEFDGPDPGTWERASVPVSGTLYDVSDSANGPVVVGAGGVVLGRNSEGWGVVVEDGPAARGRTLYTVAATADGKRVWFAGAGGALGSLDLTTGERSDRSRPNGLEGALVALCVAGPRGEEKLLVGDQSGNVVPGSVGEDDVDWDRATTPTGGTALAALAADGPLGYGVDGDGDVWRTTADGWERIGIDDADGTLTSVAAREGRLLVGGSNGRVYACDDHWVPFDVGGGTVRSVDHRADGGAGGDDAEGELLAGGDGALLSVGRDGDWTTVDVDGDAAIRGVALTDPAVAVGSGGFLLERTATGDESSQ